MKEICDYCNEEMDYERKCCFDPSDFVAVNRFGIFEWIIYDEYDSDLEDEECYCSIDCLLNGLVKRKNDKKSIDKWNTDLYVVINHKKIEIYSDNICSVIDTIKACFNLD